MALYELYVMAELNEPDELKDAEHGDRYVIIFEDDGERDTLTAKYRKPIDGGSIVKWDTVNCDIVEKSDGYTISPTVGGWEFDVIEIHPVDK